MTVAERYPNQLADSLIQKGITLTPVDIVAKTGWTTDELDAGINDRTDLQNIYLTGRLESTRFSSRR
ncbi:MAG: hypothetical protein AAFZ63_24370 [Bacteroidota bacterium]